ncbi:uncharacterized protein EI90DRAFT_3021744 [Cantharellus anzutake]|uniref:uncharacterized protein n=1 Tax=Cantharellus anzutake TaxID=1750568 RepID=UPI001908936B|nr:uncharacterized protein EI90DRAFT_3021744 [Cantharellus anzutake]KAF8316005.1 hypothetical protein EI90DRAFT_3021744 [Cantharellus anzutake]
MSVMVAVVFKDGGWKIKSKCQALNAVTKRRGLWDGAGLPIMLAGLQEPTNGPQAREPGIARQQKSGPTLPPSQSIFLHPREKRVCTASYGFYTQLVLSGITVKPPVYI